MANNLSSLNKTPFFKSKRVIIALICIMTIIVLSIIIGMIIYFQSQSKLDRIAYENLQRSSAQISTNITGAAKNNLKIVKTIADSEIVQSMDPARISPYLKTAGQKYDLLTSFYAVGPDGQPIASSVSGKIKNFADTAYFKAAMQGQANISNLLVERDTHDVIVIFSAPVQKDGKVIGVVIAGNTTKTWVDLMASAQNGQSDEAYLIDPSGYFITPSRFTETLKAEGVIKTSSELELKDESFGATEALTGHSGIGEFTSYRGTKVLGVYQPLQIGNNQMGLINIIEEDEVYAPLAGLKILIPAIILIADLFLSILALVIIKILPIH
jgi:methyl-accepting chemotaxis protein